MSDRPDGGPFHPQYSTDRHGAMFTQDSGASLRDWFAAMASEADITEHMTGLVGFWGAVDEETGQRTWRSPREQARYRYADAMIEARSK